MDELQLRKIEQIRNALNDLYKALDVDLYEKVSSAKTSYKLKKPNSLVNKHLEYVVKRLNELRDGE